MHLLMQCVAPALLALTLLVSDGRAQGPREWIDVHVHLIADKGAAAAFDEAARTALQIMDNEGIRAIVAMSPPRPREDFDIESLAPLAAKYGPRIAVAGGGGSLNPMLHAAGKSMEVSEEVRRRFEETARRIVKSGARAFGEITAHHVSMLPNHPYESTPADHPLFLLLADIAAEHRVPIDLHFDPVPAEMSTPANLGGTNPPMLRANLAGFERLLAHNRKATIVWAHAGTDPVGHFTPRLVREMLRRHPNLALSIRPTGPFPGAMAPLKGPLNDEWIAVLRDFPDRFVIGSDNFIVASAFSKSGGPAQMFAQRAEFQRRGIRRLLSELPPDLARRIGYENAERIYGLRR